MLPFSTYLAFILSGIVLIVFLVAKRRATPQPRFMDRLIVLISGYGAAQVLITTLMLLTIKSAELGMDGVPIVFIGGFVSAYFPVRELYNRFRGR